MVLFALAAGLALTACGDDGLEGTSTDVSHETAVASGEPSGDLTISNWPFYVDKQTIPEFQDETGIQVKYVEDVNSYEEFFAKMQPLLSKGESGGRSLMVASDWLAKRMYDLGYIQKLDQDAIAPALQNLNPVASQGGDPDHQYSIPWQGGMTGLIVNTNEAPDLTSVNDLLDDPQYKGRVEIVSEMREVVPLFMKGAGIDPESATKQDWLDTFDRLEQARDAGQIRRITGTDDA
jgi:spermidine/putrescine transport system substrate-binding protein